jgi:hypothetical protein
MRPGRNAPGPQGAALPAGDDGGLLGVHFLLARDEGAPAGLVRAGAPDLHFGAINPQFDAADGGIGEHVGQGAQPHAGLAGHGEPAGREQRADLADRPGDGRPVHPVQPGQGGVGKLEPQVNEGDDDPVGERQVMIRARARGAHTVVAAAFAQPGFLGGHPGAGQFGDELAEPSRLQAGEDTLAQGRAGPSGRHIEIVPRGRSRSPDRHAEISRYAADALSRTKS